MVKGPIMCRKDGLLKLELERRMKTGESGTLMGWEMSKMNFLNI